MPRYAAFLRGVMPTNARMPALKAAFEAAGFERVATVLGSGNVVFDARAQPTAALEKKAEAAMRSKLGTAFPAFVRPVAELEALLASDPFRGLHVSPEAKRVVTFVRGASAGKVRLPIERDGARILRHADGMVFSAYLPTPKGPVFMALIDAAFGKEQTTRTWRTIARVVRA